MSLSKLLTPDEVSELLGVTSHTLAVWRSERRYNLPYIKAGRLVRYRAEDIQRFVEERTEGQTLGHHHG